MTMFSELSLAEKAVIEYAGRNAFARLSWMKSGGQEAWDEERALKDWLTGEKEVKKQLYHLSVSEALEKITAVHAETIWRQNGAVKDLNLTRMQADWENAKHYIAYLIAEDFVSCCLDKRYESHDDCYMHLREEYIDYLLDLSVENYIKIKAYFRRQADLDEGKSQPADQYYFQAEKELSRARRHCKRLSFAERVKSVSDAPTSFLLSNCDLTKIANGREFTLNRLRLNSTMVQEYIDRYYPTVRTAINRLSEDNRPPDIHELIRANDQVSNMLEFFLRCAICAAIPLEEYDNRSHRVVKSRHLKESLLSSVPPLG